MKKKHRNIPIFIPHMGCPNQCVFCNQRSISGHSSFREEQVKDEIDQALSTTEEGSEVEIAFFGGSFTGIERGLMLRLLTLAQSYVEEGRVTSIRLSTRPDYISKEILKLLSGFSVRHIELGLQSMDDNVLSLSKRGHDARTAQQACRAVVEAGFELVGQMMVGLPGATPESEIQTAREICRLGATAARIYPTVVFYDTPLCDMLKRGDYTPLTLEDAIVRTANAWEVFSAHSVPCIRIGICASEDLVSEERVAAGPNHPALGELVLGECAYRKILEGLRNAGLLGKQVILAVPPSQLSQAVGQRRRNLERLYRESGTEVRKMVRDSALTEICVFPYPSSNN